MKTAHKIWMWASDRKHLEAWFWTAALIALALTHPQGEGHLSLCPIKNLGWSFCPGCGLGHSISWLFRGELRQSFHTHPLGVFATGMLLFRIFQLFLNNYFTKPDSNF